MKQYEFPVPELEDGERFEYLDESICHDWLKTFAKKCAYVYELHDDASIAIYYQVSSQSYEVIKFVDNEEYSYGKVDTREELLRLLCLLSPKFASNAEVVAIRDKFMPPAHAS